ncbi:MAG TPA: hypothetical protein VLJ21_01500 [Candidatus Binatia bacterium]|nr:hypothetical protein [Candidatus Binatia bacterium]
MQYIKEQSGVTAMGLFDVFGKKKEPMMLPPPPMPDLEEHPEAMDFPEPPQELEALAPMDEAPMESSEPMPEPRAPHRIDREGPLFVSVQDYQMILNGVTAIKSKLSATDESFKKLHDVKAAQEKQLELWRQSLEDVQRKLTYVDEVLFGR